jgi:hypothetical protein
VSGPLLHRAPMFHRKTILLLPQCRNLLLFIFLQRTKLSPILLHSISRFSTRLKSDNSDGVVQPIAIFEDFAAAMSGKSIRSIITFPCITSDLNFQPLMTFTTFADFTIQWIGFRIRFGDDNRSFILFSISLFNHS